MLERALELQEACDMFCHGAEARKYSLNPFEWDKVSQMTKFLKPLYEATLFLCKSEYLTLKVSLPF
jgi:hypothetical protein